MARRKKRPTNCGYLYENHRRLAHLSRSELVGFADTEIGRFRLTMDRDKKNQIYVRFEPWGWGNGKVLQVLSRIRKIKKPGTDRFLFVGDVNLMGHLFQIELTGATLAKTKRKVFNIRLKEVF